MATERPKLTVVLDDELLKKIEDYRYLNRLRSKSQATYNLIELGFKYLEEKEGYQK